jgi:lipid-binding SYLF domain-containing protein
MRRLIPVVGVLAAAAFFVAGCATAPRTEQGKEKLSQNVQETLRQLNEQDPGLQDFLSRAHAYAIFPSVGKGGAGIGGSYGRGEVYEQGKLVGYADISQATIGAQLGGQSFTEIIAFENQSAFAQFRRGEFKFAANASAVALKSGVARTARYTDGVATFVNPKSGLMAEAAVGGQSFSFLPI